MARQKGTANFSGTLEVLAGGPIDSRTVVPTKADLTVAANFPYAYVGLEVYVTAENKKYRLINADVTQASSWEEVGSGSEITVDDEMSSSSTNPVQNKVITTALAGKVNTSAVGTANGVAELDNAGKVPSSQLPSYVDDVIEGYAKIANPPKLGAVIAKLNSLAGSTINAGSYANGLAHNSIITKNANGKFNIYGIYANNNQFNTLIEFHGTASNFSIKNVSGEPCQTFHFMPENMSANGTITNMSQGAIADGSSWNGFDGSQGIWINTAKPIDISDFLGGLVNLDVPYVISFYSDASFQNLITPESGKIYVDLITDTSYRWSGTAYIAIGGSLVLGETSGSAYPGDKGKKATDSIGDLTQLETEEKSNLVEAINEVLENAGSSYTAGYGIDISEEDEISTDNMPSEDMAEIISPLPGSTPRWMKYSTDEQVIGEWIDGKPIYQKTIIYTIQSGDGPGLSIPIGASVKEYIKSDCMLTNTPTGSNLVPSIATDASVGANAGGLQERNGSDIIISYLLRNNNSSNPNEIRVLAGYYDSTHQTSNDPVNGLLIYVGRKLVFTIQYTKTTD